MSWRSLVTFQSEEHERLQQTMSLTQQQWLKRADSGNQAKKVLQQQNAHSESTLRLKVFRFLGERNHLAVTLIMESSACEVAAVWCEK